jgi:alpha-L-fucosidase 2
MDMQILRDLFTDYLKAAEILGDTDRYFIEKTERLLSKIPPIGIGKHGQIMEWPEDYEEAEPGHRHISQLYALFPSSQIPTDDPENALFKAARATLERRLHYGGGHTGWSRAWIMNLYARLRDGEKVYENLTALLKRSTLDNLFDNHPPFQIDGNFGALSAIVGMFLQCFDNRVCLLPALPKAFANGSFTGIRAYHGGVFDLRFQNGALTDFTVKAQRGDYEAEVIYDCVTFSVKLSEGEEKLIRII